MNHTVLKKGEIIYVEAGKDFIISGEQEALDLAAFCWEKGTAYLLVNHTNLTDDFFNLKTGLAGAVLQKFSTYRIRAAAIIDPVRITGRFSDLVTELNRGQGFRIFENKDDAEEWLLKL